MLRLRDGQAIVWEELLPEQVRLLSPELEAIDQLLDHERFLQPFIERFWCPVGRPTIPIESYLRLMYLKHRYGLGYETLCREVSDSISWRRFCRIALDKRVPHPTTLSKLTRRFGPEIVEDLNRALLERAVEAKLIRSRRLRVDTTCIEADVRYPTDSGLCAHAISRLGRAVRSLKLAGLATRTAFHDRRRSAGKAVRRVSGALARGGNSRAAVDRQTAMLHQLASRAARQAARVLTNARRSLRARGRPGGAQVARLSKEIARAERVNLAAETRQGTAVVFAAAESGEPPAVPCYEPLREPPRPPERRPVPASRRRSRLAPDPRACAPARLARCSGTTWRRPGRSTPAPR